MLNVSNTESDSDGALRAGADGCLLKDMEPEEIVSQLNRAVQGHIVLSDSASQLIARSLRDEANPKTSDKAGLTARETQILNLVAHGLRNKLIAREPGIVEGTVKIHLKHRLRKLSLRSRVEAVVWAAEHLGQ